jgi:hypothetical protein
MASKSQLADNFTVVKPARFDAPQKAFFFLGSSV